MINKWNEIVECEKTLYDKMMNKFYPAKGSTGFSERNLSVNFAKAYEKYKGEDVITWFEFQWGKKNDKHLDAIVINYGDEEVLLIESKRFSNVLKKTNEIAEDIERINEVWREVNDRKDERIRVQDIKHFYGVILADVWVKKSDEGTFVTAKGRVKQSFVNNSFVQEVGKKWSEQHRLLQSNLTYDIREVSNITSKENYYLLFMVWELKDAIQ